MFQKALQQARTNRKEEEMKGYKGFRKGLICKGKQYAENTVFEEEESVICENGMHFCKNPFDVLDYYGFVDEKGSMNEFAEVEALAETDTNDNKKYCTTKLKVGAKLSFAGFVKTCVDFVLEKTTVEIGDADENKIGSSGYSAQIGSSGDSAQIGSSGNYAQIGSSGDSAQIGSSGNSAQIGSSGNSAQIGSSGYSAQIGSSGDSAQIGSSGYSAKIGSSGDYAQIGSSGNSAKIGSSGNYAQIGSSGNSAKIGSSGNYAQIGSSGNYAQIGSSGDSAQIGSSGDSAQIGSSGNYAQIGSSGDSAQIDSTGEDSVICCAGHNSTVKAKKGSWITLSEWEYSEEKSRIVPLCVKTEYVDGKRIKADTFYRLVKGEFKEVNQSILSNA
jgi:hypothetical protein